MQEELKKAWTIIGIVVLGFILLIGVLVWSAKKDKALNEWATQYEDCVTEEYKTTPTAWYAENGEYPECDTK